MRDKIYVNGAFLTQKVTGVQRFAINQIKVLAKSYEVILLAPRGDYFFADEENISILKIGNFKSRHFWEQISLRMWVWRNKKKILNLSGFGVIGLSEQVVTVHDLSFRHKPEWFTFLYRSVYYLAYFIQLSGVQKIFTVSDFSRSEIVKYYPKIDKDKICVVYNDYDNEFEAVGHTRNNNQILLVGSNDPRKNQQKFIDAFIEMKLPDYELLVVGGCSRSFAKQKLNAASSRVTFLGYISDKQLKEMYASVGFFAYPSLYEGFGLPPLEAYASGCQCLMSDISVFHEIYGDLPKYVDPTSTESIQAGILACIDDLNSDRALIPTKLPMIRKLLKSKSILHAVEGFLVD